MHLGLFDFVLTVCNRFAYNLLVPMFYPELTGFDSGK